MQSWAKSNFGSLGLVLSLFIFEQLLELVFKLRLPILVHVLHIRNIALQSVYSFCKLCHCLCENSHNVSGDKLIYFLLGGK